MFRMHALGILTAIIALAFPPVADAETKGESQLLRLITSKIVESNRVVLKGNTRPEATKANDRGRVPDDFSMGDITLVLKRPPSGELALKRYVDELTKPASPNFHRWLSAKTVGARYGMGMVDLAIVTGWLTSHNFRVHRIYPNRLTVDFSGTAKAVREAFHTEIHFLTVNGDRHFANMRDPQIPAALAPAVVGILSLHDFRPEKSLVRSVVPCTQSCYWIVPADLATIYNFTPLFTNKVDGHHQIIVDVEDSDVYSYTDWDTFRKKFGLASHPGGFEEVHPEPPPGGQNCFDPSVTPDADEAIIDAEYASAAAPGAAIINASCAGQGSTQGYFIAMNNLVNDASNPPSIISISYQTCEATNGNAANTALYGEYETAAAEGASIFVSSDDNGGAGCDYDKDTNATDGLAINAFAATPFNVAVGGTDFSDTYYKTQGTYWSAGTDYDLALSYIPEIPWNSSCGSELLSIYLTGSSTTYGSNGFCNSALGQKYYANINAGGGGASSCFYYDATCIGLGKPSWQSGFAGIVSDGVRDVPDVSLFAANGAWNHEFIYCNSGDRPCTGSPSKWSTGGGTSFSAPIWAGIQALIDQTTGTREGNPNPAFYALAAQEYGTSGNSACESSLGVNVSSTCVFYDVVQGDGVQGDTDVPCTGTNNCFLPSGNIGVLSTSNQSYLPAFTTTVGWDYSTGIGSPNVANLVSAWNSVAGMVKFKLKGVTFDDGGTATGSFAFIPTWGGVIAKITTTPGREMNGYTYTTCKDAADNNWCQLYDLGNGYDDIEIYNVDTKNRLDYWIDFIVKAPFSLTQPNPLVVGQGGETEAGCCHRVIAAGSLVPQ